MNRLSDKTCIVTGAAKGIGAAIAKAYAEENAKVVVTDVNDEVGRAFAKEIGADYVHLDVADEEDWRALEERYPKID
ncbi:MAG: SDR family NAD(P)-dependent oxidoreductase, partial [Hyphomicrobiales bacterium]